MQGDPDQFEADVARWVEQAKGLQDEAYQATAMMALARVKELTPVRTGFLRASWAITSPGAAMPTHDQAEAVSMETVAKLKVGDRILIVNPAPYAMRINFGFVGEDKLGRHYNEKGRHMVEQTLAEMPQISRQAVAWIMGGGTPFTLPEEG